MKKVFLSYSRKDSDVADQVAVRIESAGHEVWIDREGIPGGAAWRNSIVDAIRSSDVVVLLVSPSLSENVEKELAIQDNLRKDLVPIMIRPVGLADLRAGIQYAIIDRNIVDLTGDLDAGIDHVLRCLGPQEGVVETNFKPRLPTRSKIAVFVWVRRIFWFLRDFRNARVLGTARTLASAWFVGLALFLVFGTVLGASSNLELEGDGTLTPDSHHEIATAHGTVYGFAWWTPGVEGCGDGNAVYRVEYRTNAAYIVVSALTLGLYVPQTVEWWCSAEPFDEGDEFLDELDDEF